MPELSRRVMWVLPLGMATAIFILSSIPGDSLPPASLGMDKLVHAFVYGVLGALIARALHRQGLVKRPELLIAIAAAIAAVYGITDELHQLWTRNRSSEVLDAVADAVGGLLGSFVYVKFWVKT